MFKKCLNKLSRRLNKLPISDYLRKDYYKRKKKYFKLLKSKKRSFFADLNAKIEIGRLIDWNALKKLKKALSNKTTNFDDYDRVKFLEFFENLYSTENNTMSKTIRDAHYTEANMINSSPTV